MTAPLGPPLPSFLIIGAMKAGTTSLAAWLGAHPDVFVAPDKEVRFFNNPDRWSLGVDWYRQQFSGHRAERAVGEATPLMQNAEAVARVAEVVPGARLIALLRQPVDRAWSQYWHLRALGAERRSFDRALRDEQLDPESARGRLPRDYLQRSRYLPQLECVCTHVPREALLVQLFDDLRDHPIAVYREACRFVDVDPEAMPAEVGTVHDPRPGRRWPALERARWLPARVRAWNAVPPRPYPPLPADVRARWTLAVTPEIEALGRWLERDLSHWTA